MRWLGFSDSQKTASGSDLGKDIDSIAAVAQVKDMGTGVSRPMVQQLFGVASAEKKIPIFSLVLTQKLQLSGPPNMMLLCFSSISEAR